MASSSRESGHGATPFVEAVTVAGSSEMGETEFLQDPTPSSSLYYSARLERMMKRRSEFATALGFEIECSKVHWSEAQRPDGEVVQSEPQTSEGGTVAEETNREVFERLKQDPQWGGFFIDWGNRLVLGRKIAQTENFEAELDGDDWYVAKVFDKGFSLRDLQSQWPLAMLNYKHSFLVGGCSGILGGTLLGDGRFAFVMRRGRGDLRRLIDERMQVNNFHGPPFPFEVALGFMGQIAWGMKGLHELDIVHRDLEASNILIFHPYTIPNIADFECSVADFECSVGVVGTGFWRAPEILVAVKNRCIEPELFTKQADVYSYAMTCYEILTGKLPFEDYPEDNPFYEAWSKVLSGQVPVLSNDVDKEQMGWSDEDVVRVHQDYESDNDKLVNKRIVSSETSNGPMASRSIARVETRKTRGPCADALLQESQTTINAWKWEDCSTRMCEMNWVFSKLGDFGIVRHTEVTAYSHTTPNQGTRLWRAPEIDESFKPEINKSFTADVFSFARACSEHLRRRPTYTTTRIEAMIREVKGVLATVKSRNPKRIRTRDWKNEEICAVLELMEEPLRVDVGPNIWDYVSGNLFEKYDFDRASDSCQQQWDTLLQSYRAILGYESKMQQIDSNTSRCVSYWDMNEDERSNKKLPRTFNFEWREMIERILTAKLVEDGTRSMQMDSESDEIDTQSEDEELSGDTAAAIESEVEFTADSHVSQTDRITGTCYDTNSNHAGRKRSAAALDEDHELMLRIAPFVDKQIEDALKPRLSALLKENIALKRTLHERIQARLC